MRKVFFRRALGGAGLYTSATTTEAKDKLTSVGGEEHSVMHSHYKNSTTATALPTSVTAAMPTPRDLLSFLSE